MLNNPLRSPLLHSPFLLQCSDHAGKLEELALDMHSGLENITFVLLKALDDDDEMKGPPPKERTSPMVADYFSNDETSHLEARRNLVFAVELAHHVAARSKVPNGQHSTAQDEPESNRALEMTSRAVEMERTLLDCDRNLEGAVAGLKELERNNQGLLALKSGLNGEVHRLQGDVVELAASIEARELDIRKLNGRISLLTSEVADLEAEVEDLNEEADDMLSLAALQVHSFFQKVKQSTFLQSLGFAPAATTCLLHS